MMETPAERSARQTHLLDSNRTTYCGIKFRRTRFLEKTTGFDDSVTCDKCASKRRFRIRTSGETTNIKRRSEPNQEAQ